MIFLFRRIAAFAFLVTTACADPLSPRIPKIDPATREYLAQFLPFNNILSVDHFIPPVAGGREVVLHFSQPMVALPAIGDVVSEDSVTVVPATRGTFEWANPKTLLFTAAEAFQNGQRYRIRVAPGFESLGGAVLVNGVEFEFTGDGKTNAEAPSRLVAFPEADRTGDASLNVQEDNTRFTDLGASHLFPVLGDAQILDLMENGVNVAPFSEADRHPAAGIPLFRADSRLGAGALSGTDSAELYSRLEQNARRTFRVDLDAPDFVRVGDRFAVRAVVTNFGREDSDAMVTWHSGGFVANCGGTEKVVVPSGGRSEISCRFSAEEDSLEKAGCVWESRLDYANAVPLGLAVSTGTDSDVETAAVAVRNERYAVEIASGLADPDARVEFEKPVGALGDFGGLDLRIENRGSREVTAAKIFLNGERIILSSLDPLRPEDGVFIPMAKLPDVMAFSVSRQRGRVLSYRFALSYALAEPPDGVVENGLSVSRVVFDGVGDRVDETLAQGREYEVRLTIYAERDVADAAIREALPAGTRIVATEKGRQARVVAGGIEISLGSVSRGLKRVSYRVLAERVGSYFWPRASVYDRFASRTSGTSGSSRIEIE